MYHKRISQPDSSSKQLSVSSPWPVQELISVHKQAYACPSQGPVTVGVLSELENTNVLGRLLAHSQEITDCLLKTCKRDMLGPRNNPLAPFLTLAALFRGQITQSALNVRPNKF